MRTAFSWPIAHTCVCKGGVDHAVLRRGKPRAVHSIFICFLPCFPASLLVLHLQALLHKAGEGVSLYDWNYVASFVVVLAFHSAANLFNT